MYNRQSRTAVCCSALQCFTVCCSVLQCVAVCCSVLQCDDSSMWYVPLWMPESSLLISKTVQVMSTPSTATWVAWAPQGHIRLTALRADSRGTPTARGRQSSRRPRRDKRRTRQERMRRQNRQHTNQSEERSLVKPLIYLNPVEQTPYSATVHSAHQKIFFFLVFSRKNFFNTLEKFLEYTRIHVCHT